MAWFSLIGLGPFGRSARSFPISVFQADCVEKLRNQSVADFLRKPMKRNSRKALTTRQRMAARERM
ncbi:MAG: hypothetical protein GKR99_10290 [Rhodobacteraceae bacterium]|nr:hypothetical protein [Paracoccaceae bacterium]